MATNSILIQIGPHVPSRRCQTAAPCRNFVSRSSVVLCEWRRDFDASHKVNFDSAFCQKKPIMYNSEVSHLSTKKKKEPHGRSGADNSAAFSNST